MTPTIYSLYIVFVSTWQKFLLNLYINILQKNPNNKDSTFQLLKNGTWYVFAQSAKKGQRILVKKVSRKVAALSLTYSTHTHLVQNSVKNTPLHNLPYFSNKKTHLPKKLYCEKGKTLTDICILNTILHILITIWNNVESIKDLSCWEGWESRHKNSTMAGI